MALVEPSNGAVDSHLITKTYTGRVNNPEIGNDRRSGRQDASTSAAGVYCELPLMRNCKSVLRVIDVCCVMMKGNTELRLMFNMARGGNVEGTNLLLVSRQAVNGNFLAPESRTLHIRQYSLA